MQDRFKVNKYEATQRYRETPKGVLTNLYSKMKNRAIEKNIEIPDFTLQDFHKMYLQDKTFLRIFNEWKLSNYDKYKKPSIDRISNKKGYLKNNIHIISWGDNRYKQIMERRSRKGEVLQILNGKIIKIWRSQREAYKKLNLQQSMLSMALTGRCKSAYGYEWKYINKFKNYGNVYENPELLEECENER